MANYQKGLQTKNAILRASRELFYLHGYSETTVRQIANHAQSSLGLMGYYFQGKSEIGAIVAQQIRDEIMNALSNYYTLNTELNFFMNASVDLTLLLENDTYRRFYLEIAHTQPYADDHRDKLAGHILPYMRRSYKTNDEFVLACICLSGLRPSVVRNVCSEKYNVSHETAIKYLLNQYTYHIGLDPALTDQAYGELQTLCVKMGENFTPILSKKTR